MIKPCEQCGKDFTYQKSTAKYCSPNCRQAHFKGIPNRADAVRYNEIPKAFQIPAGQVLTKPDSGSALSPLTPGSAEVAAVVLLTKADRLDTVLGYATIALARRVDDAQHESGASLATVVKQLQTTLEAAMAGAIVEADVVDDLRERRLARSRG